VKNTSEPKDTTLPSFGSRCLKVIKLSA